MIVSMTGYGHAIGEFDSTSYAVEIRTVNNRYLKLNIRIPESAGFLEDEIERTLKAGLNRGMVNYSLRIKSLCADELVNIDSAILKGYFEQLQKAGKELSADSKINLVDLLSLPGVIQPVEPDEERAAQMKKQVLKVTADAIEQLRQMRAEEGKSLLKDLDENCAIIAEKSKIIEGRIGQVVQEYHEKLRKRIEVLLSKAQLKIDEDLLAREVAIFAERSDISEELSRLKSHLSQFEQTCQSEGHAGRKLDFITQELLREANTIASKASDALIAGCVVDIKCSIDRIKEQVQNVE